MSDQPLLYNQQGALVTLTLNQPKSMNALSDNLLAALAEATARLERDDSVRAVILTGAGRAFCAGAI